MRIVGVRGGFLADADQLLDGREGLGQNCRRGFADVADAEGEDEAVEFGLAPRVDGGEQFFEALEATVLDGADVLAGLAGGLLAQPGLLVTPGGESLLHGGSAVAQREDIGGGLHEARVEEQVDVLRSQTLDIHGAAGHEMPETLDRLGGADQLAGAAAARIFLAGLLVELTRRG